MNAARTRDITPAVLATLGDCASGEALPGGSVDAPGFDARFDGENKLKRFAGDALVGSAGASPPGDTLPPAVPRSSSKKGSYFCV